MRRGGCSRGPRWRHWSRRGPTRRSCRGRTARPALRSGWGVECTNRQNRSSQHPRQKYRGGWGFRVEENPNLQIVARQNPCHFLTMGEQSTRGWHKLLMRNSGRLLLLPGGFSWCIRQRSCLHPIKCHRNTTNEARPLQRFRDFHRKLRIINQLLGHGTSEQGHSLTHTRANPQKHRTNCAQTLRTGRVTQKSSPVLSETCFFFRHGGPPPVTMH